MTKSVVIHIRITPELLSLVRKAAAIEGRKVSDWGSRALETVAKLVKAGGQQ